MVTTKKKCREKDGDSNMSIEHAIGYCEVYMRSNDPDAPNEIDVFKSIGYALSPDEVVNILKDSVRRSGIRGHNLILKEMDTNRFRRYIEMKLNPVRMYE